MRSNPIWIAALFGLVPPDPRHDLLDKRVAQVEAGLVAALDTNFDGNTYRQALVASFREQLFDHLRNYIILLSVLGGLGGALLAKYYIADEVGKAVREREGDLDRLTDATRRYLLTARLERAKPEGFPKEMVAVTADEGRLVEESIRAPQSSFEREAALAYAVHTKETRYARAIVDALVKAEEPLPNRVTLLASAVEMSGEDVRRPLLTLATEEVSRGSRMGPALVDALSYLQATSNEAANIAATSLRSNSDELREAALLFYTVNPTIPIPASASERLKKVKRLRPMWSLFSMRDDSISGHTENSIVGLLGLNRLVPSRRVTGRTLEYYELYDLAAEEHPAQVTLQSTEIGRRALGEYFVRRALQQGRLQLAKRYLVRYGTFSEQTWLQVNPLFRGLSELAAKEQPTRLDRDVVAQEVLRRSADLFIWRKGEESFVLIDEETSLASLADGKLDDFLTYMDNDYYNEKTWAISVRPLFPDYQSSLGVGFTNEDLQDDLALWVGKMKRVLVWKELQHVWRLPTQPRERAGPRSIPAGIGPSRIK